MSDYAQLLELRANVGGNNITTLTANITNGSTTATLSATSNLLMGGRDYYISGTGLPPNCRFRYFGTTAITLSDKATATNATAAVTIKPVTYS